MSTRPLDRFLNGIEKAGNKLPDPAILFVIALVLVWILRALLSPIAFAEIDPRNGQPIKVLNLLSGTAMAGWRRHGQHVRDVPAARGRPGCAQQARLMHLPEGSPGLFIERRTFLDDGRVVEYTRSFFRGDAYDFVAALHSE